MHTRNIPLGLLMLATVAGVCVSYARLTAGEIQESTFHSYAEVERSGLMERGWIPPWLPRSATEIWERHDLDTNAVALRFRAPEADLRSLVHGFEPLRSADALRSARTRFGSELPEALDLYGAPAPLSGMDFCVWIDWQTHTAYAWTCWRERIGPTGRSEQAVGCC